MLMKKLKTIFHTWTFLYRHEKYGMLWGVALVITGLYPAATALISREVVNSILILRPNLIGPLPNSFFYGIVYGAITLLHGMISSYSAIELVNVKDRTAAVTDRLLMKQAASSFDVTAYEVPETRDRIRLASVGAKALPTCFTGSVEVLQHVLMVIALSLILLYYHPLIAALVFLPAIPLFYTQLKVRSHTFAALVYKSPLYRQMGYLLELMLGSKTAKEIRVYRSGNFFLEKYRQAANEVFKLARDLRWKGTLRAVGWGSVAAVGIGGAYIYIIYLATVKRINIGDVVMYSSAVFYAGGSIRSLIQSSSSLWTNLLEVETFFSYLGYERAAPTPKVLSACGGREEPEWVIKDLTYAYPGRDRRVLDAVSLSIQAKQKIAIVGFNGAGKTTLLKLMLRLLEPDEGTITFRGADLKEWDVPALRKIFGVVFQDFSRFKLTLFENIGLAKNGSSTISERDEAVFRAARLTGVDEIAKNAPQGYETQLGKEFLNGTDLSGGQWQKVALARGFVRDASVIFLDEPTASVDPKTEKTVFEQLLSLAEGKTAIVISHRLFITPLVDHIFVLEQGRLIEQGTHDELMERDGVYARMYKTQAGMYWPRNSIAS